MTFKEAFRKARAAGKKTFTWNGKSYTTQTAEEAAAVKNAPSRPSTRPRARPSRSEGPSSSPRPRQNPRASRPSADTEDRKGNTGRMARPSPEDRRVMVGQTRLAGAERIRDAVGPLRKTLEDRWTQMGENERRARATRRPTRPSSRPSAERYQRGATGPRR